MAITDKINEIIARRKGYGQWEGQGRVAFVEKKIQFYRGLLSTLEDYALKRDSILREINQKQGDFYLLTAEVPDFSDALENASPEKAFKAVRDYLRELESLKKRFDRDTINISVIGRAGQGKSRLLQSISGVENDVIPADSGGDCTGAKSIICNDSGETRAIVRFFTESELISNVQEYLSRLDSDFSLGTISQIQSLPIDAIFEKVKDNKQESYYERLCSYVKHYNEYIGYLGGEKTVSKNEIREYVAQYLQDGTKVYKYLAVKEVEILTPFVNSDAGKIMLVDTIGLGDTSIGLREKMIDTLINDSDAAILLRRPDPERDNIREEDNELYDGINEKMVGRDLSLWLFYVLNTYGKNQKTSNQLFESLNRKKGKTLQVAFIKQLDCADKAVVDKELIEPLLATISENLNDIDDSLIKLANKKAGLAFDEIIALNNILSSIMSESLKSSPAASGLFKQLYKSELQLLPALRELNIEYKERNKVDQDLEGAILSVLKNISKHIPSEEEIVIRLKKGDASSRVDTVFNRVCDNLRAHIRNDFDHVCFSTIKEMQDKIKKRIIRVLQTEGLLSKIPLKVSVDDGEEVWLEALITERMNQYESIQSALNEILNYHLHIEGLLQFKVHCALDILEEHSLEEAPEGKRIKLEQAKIDSLTTQEIASVIHQTLLECTYTFAQDLRKSIQELLIIPNNSFNSLIRKLREVLGYDEDSEDMLEVFYHDYAQIIWKDKFDEVKAHDRNVQQLKSITSCFENHLNKQDYLF